MNDILGEREAQHPFQWEDESRDSQDDRSVIIILPIKVSSSLSLPSSGPRCFRPPWTTETTRATAWGSARLRLVMIIIINHQCHYHYHPQVSPARLTSRQRLVLRLKRIHDTYYMVEDTDHPDYLNYSHIRSEKRNKYPEKTEMD